MTDDLDAEIKLIQDRMRQHCIARFVANGLTLADAEKRPDDALNAPPAIPLPTFEELDEPAMTESENAKLIAWLRTDPLPELTNVVTVREIKDTDDLAVGRPRPGCPLPQGSWGTIVGVSADGGGYLVEFEAPWHLLELQRSDIMPDEPIDYADMMPEQQRIVDAGRRIAGSFPPGLSRDELSAWIRERFVCKD
jgi:hypothetical protein